MKEIFYTGIGSRNNVPDDVLDMIGKIAEIFAKKGFTLRSGGAEGCDQKFEFHCDKFNGKKEIYLPWKLFCNNPSPLFTPSSLAQEIAFEHHPNLYGQSEGVIKLLSRNTHQVLGQTCTRKTASDFVVCYCPIDKAGKLIGGTSQALRICKNSKYNIPIFNLLYKESLQELKDFVAQVDLD